MEGGTQSKEVGQVNDAIERWALFDPQGELLLVPSYRTDTEAEAWWEWICWNGNGELSHQEECRRWEVEPIIERMKREGYRVERVRIERADGDGENRPRCHPQRESSQNENVS